MLGLSFLTLAGILKKVNTITVFIAQISRCMLRDWPKMCNLAVLKTRMVTGSSCILYVHIYICEKYLSCLKLNAGERSYRLILNDLCLLRANFPSFNLREKNEWSNYLKKCCSCLMFGGKKKSGKHTLKNPGCLEIQFDFSTHI